MPAMIERKTIAEWERYPLNLSSSTNCPVDWNFYRDRLSEAASHLFTQNADASAVEAFISDGTAT